MSDHLLLTGGAGFIGSHLVDHLLANTDWRITVLDGLSYAGDPARLYESVKFDLARVRILWHDLNASLMDTLMRRIGPVDYVVNMASNSHIDKSIADPAPFVKNNVNIALHMLEYARSLKLTAFLQVGTDEEYGSIEPGGVPYKEWAPINPSNPYCLLPGSQVITPRGPIRIEDFDISRDRVISKASASHVQSEIITQKFTYDYDGPAVNLRTDCGVINATAEHKFFRKGVAWKRKDGWPTALIEEVNAEALKKGDYVLVARYIPEPIDALAMPHSYAKFLGYFLGDGCYSPRTRYVRLADNDRDRLVRYQAALGSLLGVSPKSSTKKFGHIYKHGSKDCHYLQFASEALRERIDLSRRAHIISQAYQMDNASAAHFLAGFFEAEAWFDYDASLLSGISLFQSDISNLQAARFLLRRLGVVSRILPENHKNGSRLLISDNLSLRNFCAKIPADKIKGATTFRKRQFAKRSNFFYWSEVLQADPFRHTGKVYDLEAHKHHNYLADYFVVHNSASKAAQVAIATAYWRTYNVPLIIIEPMNAFGERQDAEKFVPKCVRAVLAGEKITLHGTPDNIGSRHYLHARNVSDAILFLLKRPVAVYPSADRPDRYNVVGGRVHNLEMATRIAGILRLPLHYKFDHNPRSRPGHDLHYGLDGAKLAALGWTAPLDFENSLRRTVLWMRDNQDW